MTQLCPRVDFYWLSIAGIDAKEVKEASMDWERRVFLDPIIKQHRLYPDKELFSLDLSVETAIERARVHGETVLSIYHGKIF